jgi:hypothetical protein
MQFKNSNGIPQARVLWKCFPSVFQVSRPGVKSEIEAYRRAGGTSEAGKWIKCTVIS